MRITNIETLKSKLSELGIRPSKNKGQNFLLNPQIASLIINFSKIEPEDSVLEVGPGMGFLTFDLAEKVKELNCVELETGFANYLAENVSNLPEERIHNIDIRKFNPEELSSSSKHVLLSNVPYVISTDVILWFIKNRSYFKRAVLLLQKEFAERIAASPGTKEYSSLSILVQLYCNIDLGPKIKGSSFYPSADVDSRLISLSVLEKPCVDIGDDFEIFNKVVRAAFGTRRKTLLNALWNAKLVQSKEELEKILNSVGIDPKRRGETLSIAEFAELARGLSR